MAMSSSIRRHLIENDIGKIYQHPSYIAPFEQPENGEKRNAQLRGGSVHDTYTKGSTGCYRGLKRLG